MAHTYIGLAQVQLRSRPQCWNTLYSRPMPRLRTVFPNDQGLLAPPRWVGLRLPRQGRQPDHRRRRDRAHQVAGDPACVGGRVDLAVPQRAHPGGRHRRRGAPAVPLPPGLADQARPDEVRPRPGGRAQAARRRAGRSPATWGWRGCRWSGRTRSPYACWTSATSAIGNDVYADTNGSFGLTTLEKRHVRKAAGQAGLPLRGQVRHRAQRRDRRPRGARRAGQPAAPARAAPSGCSPTRKRDDGATWTPRP